MIEFELTKQQMSGHNVAITSWFDPDKKVWHASAPAYINVIHNSAASQFSAQTREQAVRNVASILSHYFEATTG